MSKEHPDEYSTEWESPSQTGGEWSKLADHVPYTEAKSAYTTANTMRRHSRIVVHSHGQGDYTLEEQGPFNGPIHAADKN